MTKKLFGTIAVVAAMFAGYSTYHAQDEIDLTGFALANVEALADKPELDCNYIRDGTQKCTVTVGAKGSIKLLKSNTILTADASGEIKFDGLVICSSGGTTACTPVECITLYEKIFI